MRDDNLANNGEISCAYGPLIAIFIGSPDKYGTMSLRTVNHMRQYRGKSI